MILNADTPHGRIIRTEARDIFTMRGPSLSQGHSGFAFLLHVSKRRPRRRLDLLFIFSPRRLELCLPCRMRPHLPYPLLASGRTAESRERPSIGARFEREVEQLEHVRIDRINRQSLQVFGTRMEQSTYVSTSARLQF